MAPAPERLRTLLSRSARYPLCALLGMSLRRMLRRAGDPPPRPGTVCVISQEKLGDALLMLPLLQALRRCFPGVRSTVLSTAANAPLYDGVDCVDETQLYRPPAGGLIRWTRRRRFTVVYSPKDHPSRTFSMLLRLLRGELTVGHRGAMVRGLCDRLVDRAGRDLVMERNMALLDVWGLSPSAEDMRWSPAGEVTAPGMPGPTGPPLVGINLSAGEPSREWGAERTAELMGSFGEDEVRFLLLGMPGREEEAGSLAAARPGTSVMCRIPGPMELARVVRELDCLVTPDTSTLHMAQLMEVPVVALFQARSANVRRFFRPSPASRLVVGPTSRAGDIPARAVRRPLVELLEGMP